jgi:UMF1 family MFS transporter
LRDKPAETQSRGALGAISWALYQFAGSPYFVMVNIFVFAAYFEKTVVGDYVKGQEVWGYIQGSAGFIVALSSPFLGALADAAGPRKPGLMLFSLASIAAMGLLWFALPGEVLIAGTAIIVCAVLMEFGIVYHNAMLTGVSNDRNIGWLSGAGYSLDYLGSVAIFLLWLQLPALGLITEAMGPHAHERLVGPLSALWLGVFMIPLFLFAPDRPRVALSFSGAIAKGLSQLGRTLRRVGHYRNLATYFIVRAIYADGMSAVFIFIGGYMGGTYGWGIEKIGLFALIVLTVPIFTSAPSGFIDDWIGSKRTIQVSLFFFTVGVIGSISTTPTEYLYFLPVGDELRAAQIPFLGPIVSLFGFTTFPEQVSLAFAMLGSCFVGPALASSRTMVARLAPKDMISELYGLYQLTGRATAFVVPLLVGLMTRFSQDQRSGFAVVIVFLVVGFIALFLVKEERATKADA